MNIECQVPNCSGGLFSKGKSFRRICQKHFQLLLNNDLSENHKIPDINSVADIRLDVEYPYGIMRKALCLCLDEISRKSEELIHLRESVRARKIEGNQENSVASPVAIFCTICARKFNHKYRLNFHMKTVHGSLRIFMCQHCGLTFKRLDGLRVHMKIHRREKSRKKHIKKSFKCEICHKLLSSSSNLCGHIKSFHTGERPHLCSLCGKTYATSAALRSHEKFHTTPFSCKVCGKVFPDTLRFEEHQYEHHSLKCRVCGKKFAHRNSFHIHMKIHEAGYVKGHKCEFCGEGFTLLSYLRKHIKRCRKRPE